MTSMVSRSVRRAGVRLALAGVVLLTGFGAVTLAQTTQSSPRPPAPPAPVIRHPLLNPIPVTKNRVECADEEPAGPAVHAAIAAGEAGFAQLAREKPEEAFRCLALFPGASATTALRSAAVAAPYDAVGAADQLLRRPGGAAVVAAALNTDLLTRSLGNGLPFYETRHELKKLLPLPVFKALEGQAVRALTDSFARDPDGLSAKIGLMLDGMTEDTVKDRFRIAAALPAEMQFQLIARVGPQLYTSSFDGVLDLLEARLKHEKRSFLDLASEPGASALWGDFFIAVVEGGRAETLFGPVAGDPRTLAMGSARVLLSPDRGLDPPVVAAALADAMDVRSEEVRGALADALIERYRATADPAVRTTVALVAGLQATRTGERPGVTALGADRFADLHPIPAVPVLSEERLFRNGVNVQRMTFYDDPDGRQSFRNFVYQHRAVGWAVQEHAGFLVLTSPERHGRRIVIVADIPWAGPAGRAAVRDYLARERLTPTVVIHRGHSYHEEETMPEINSGTALVFWGSCGGYARLRATLEQAPDSLVLATQNIGTARINGVLLRAIEDRMLEDGTIDWEAAWRDARARIRDQRFAAYRRPDQNSALLALRAWRTAKGTMPQPVQALPAGQRPVVAGVN